MTAAQVPASRDEEWLALALESADLGMWEWDLASGAFVRSPGHDEMFGYANEQSHWDASVAAHHVLDEDKLILQQAFAQVLAKGYIEFEVR